MARRNSQESTEEGRRSQIESLAMADDGNPARDYKPPSIKNETSHSDTASINSKEFAHSRPLERTQSEPQRTSVYANRASQATYMTNATDVTTATNATDDSDVLSPLEHAYSGGYQSGHQSGHDEITHVRTATSIGSSASRPPGFEVVFDDEDKENPRFWPKWYRGWVIFSISWTTWVIILYSTTYTAAIPGVMEQFNIDSQPVATLGLTVYLLGLACGSLLVAPSSELFGRRPAYMVGMVLYTLLIIPACLATSLAEILVVRFLGALFGSVMITNAAGTVVDISTDDNRALVMSLWSIAPINGPVTGPLIGGFVFEYLGWRWDNWVVLIAAGFDIDNTSFHANSRCTIPGTLCMMTVKETYSPIILQNKAARMRKEMDDPRWWCRYDVKLPMRELLRVNLVRPITLAIGEPILWFFNVWISLIYGILYLCFVAYPIVFEQHRGWSSGITGLSFIGIGIGTFLVIISEPLLRKVILQHPPDPVTGKVPPEATTRVMIIGACLVPIGQLVFSWTCLPATIHWAIPIAFGIPFGAGNTMSFIYGSNYLAGAYGIYAASALAGNAVTRSIFGGVLPLAGPAMYERLTPQWAGTLLGLLELTMIPIPILFYKYGERIRARSPIIKQMREDAEKNERRIQKAHARNQRKDAKEVNQNSVEGVKINKAVDSDVEKNGGGNDLVAVPDSTGVKDLTGTEK